MTTTAPAQARPQAESAATGRVRQLIWLSAVFLAIQVAYTDYGDADSRPAAAVSWFITGAVLLWFVYRRRSRVARAVAAVSALMGAVVYASVAVGSLHAAVLMVASLGQALPLLAGPVRRHVHSRP